MGITGSEQGNAATVGQWARQTLQSPFLAVEMRESLEGMLDVIENARYHADRRPFLTVVMRTQGRRLEQIQDALLCLAAQTDPDFRVLIMLHDVAEDTEQLIRSYVESYPHSFSSRVKLCEVSGGGRSRPLTASIPHLESSYVAFFDDDDLLMANWVEEFRVGASNAPGKVIRANVAIQTNLPEQWSNGSDGQRTVSAATPGYDESFSHLRHLERNRSPFMGFAFPTEIFSTWGVRFDEELLVCEDWDVILKAAGLVGVYSVEGLTAIYRLWKRAQTSYTDHDESEWAESEETVRQRANSSAFLMQPGATDELVRLLSEEHQTRKEMAAVLNSPFWKVTAPVRHAVTQARSRRRK